MASALSCRRCAHHGMSSKAAAAPRSHIAHIVRTPVLTRSTQNGNGAVKVSAPALDTIGRKELADAVSASLNLSKRVSEEAINVLLDTIVAKVATGHKVSLPGFGSWEAKKRASRNGRNPLTGEALVIPEKTVPRFAPGTKFRETVDPSVKEAKEAAKAKRSSKKKAAAAK